MTVVKKPEGMTEDGFPLGATLGRAEVKGEVGLEIEIEGANLPHENKTPKPWVYHVDNSLRGDDTGEYVLGQPIAFDGVHKALGTLWEVFDKMDSRMDDSNRTSVHVHLNVQPFYLNRLTSFMALYLSVEELLTEWCGEHRVGNLFCLRAKDAPAIVSQIRRFIRMNMEAPLKEHLHYSAMNANAIMKFGSLEFRTLRGVSDPGVIEEWVGILRRLYDLSADYPDPRDICGLFSGVGPVDFFEEVLGPKAAVIRNGISFTSEQIGDSMFEGIRLAQDICYSRDWAKFKAVRLQPDPFGRDAKKLIKKLSSGNALADILNYNNTLEDQADEILQQLATSVGSEMSYAQMSYAQYAQTLHNTVNHQTPAAGVITMQNPQGGTIYVDHVPALQGQVTHPATIYADIESQPQWNPQLGNWGNVEAEPEYDED